MGTIAGRDKRGLLLAVALAVPLVTLQPAHACGFLDVICHISESIGSGAGKGVADSVRPLVTQVMEQEAPALIAQLQAAVNNNIMTAEQAGEVLAKYTTDLLNKAADDFLANAQNRAQLLVEYAAQRMLDVEQRVYKDVVKIIAQLHCEILGIDIIMQQQQQIFNDNTNSFLSRILFWQRRQSQIESACRQDIGISPNISYANLGVPTSFELWRCVRLAYVDIKGPATAIRDAFNDTEYHGRATMCALQSGADTSLRNVTEAWITDGASARAWDRAIKGN